MIACSLQQHAVSFKNRYRRLGDLKDLEAALQKFQETLKLIPYDLLNGESGYPDRARCLDSIANCLLDRYEELGELHDLKVAVQKSQEAADHIPKGHASRAEFLSTLAISLREIYQGSGNVQDLNAAMGKFQEVVELTSEGHPDRGMALNNLASVFDDQYQILGDLSDLQETIKRLNESLILHPEHQRAMCLRNIAVSLVERYRRLGDLNDLEDAVQKSQEAVNSTPEGHPARGEILKAFSMSLSERYKRFGNINDLNNGLQRSQDAVNTMPESSPTRAPYLHDLALSFIARYRRLGSVNDLKNALQKSQEAVKLTPDSHPDRVTYLQGCAVALDEQYKRFGDLQDLEAAFQKSQEVVKLTRETDLKRAERLDCLASTSRSLFERLGDIKYWEAAKQIYQEVAKLIPPGHPDRSDFLRMIALFSDDQYQLLGDLKDLEGGLQALQQSVDLTPEGHPERATHLHSLAQAFSAQYKRFGDLADLDAALQKLQGAVNLTPSGHPDRAGYLSSLGSTFCIRYERLRSLSDLTLSVQRNQEAVDITPKEHRDMAPHLHSLAISLRERYQRLGNLNDLQTAVQMSQYAVELTPEGHRFRMSFLQSLAVFLHHRYERLEEVGDLQNAIQICCNVVKTTAAEDPDRAVYLQNLAGYFLDRYKRFRDPGDLEAVHTYYGESFKNSSSDPEYSWERALIWASIPEEFQPSYGQAAYTAAFRLLPELLWLGNSMPVRHNAIPRLGIAEATANAMRISINLSNLTSAVEFMEQGLATTFQQILQLKTDVDSTKLPRDQAEAFRNLSSELYRQRSPNPREIAYQRKGLLDNIRRQPGLEYFLLPKPYKVLCCASKGGPVVILTSHKEQCEGIIITNPTSEPVHVPLPNVTLNVLELQRERLSELLGRCNVKIRGPSAASRLFDSRPDITTPQEGFADMLDWLWATHNIHDGRLWWLPSGAFAGLPLHASPPSNQSQFIHSYTATLGSLLDAQAKPSAKCKLGIVGVSHTDANGANPLEGVDQEVQNILSAVGATHIQSLKGPQATAESVKHKIQDCSWIHLACHGKQDIVSPPQSSLLLYGSKLELEDILRMDLPNAQFVFLAACQTGMGDSVLINESFHLGGGFIAAGFRAAIGTMWSMEDKDGPLVSQLVYSHLFGEGRQPQASDTAEALHLAVKELKARGVTYERWIPFIHMGV
ncbi:CHAT domain-containing protein [Mycena maculata]|uniref:CHAT domain-containing protein n=1 Tax=Mycena maculata TaxID=230809 RepID=A0AAD7IJ57_9AGAR|nr:CHAT domain-containing protein [Mycena maculata]